ncbi:unnamed protein product [Peniophora sp. CBMAI 1063]|nr:unnamed protein product [Peniophora sp. CBMAI 1063]
MTRNNPEINWTLGVIDFSHCPDLCEMLHDDEDDPLADEGLELGDQLFAFDIESYARFDMDYRNTLHTRAFQTHTSKIAEQKASQEKEKKTFQERVPSAYHDFKDIFNKEEFDQLPPCTPYDHALELTKDFKPIHMKNYPMAPAEQEALDRFLEENLRSGRI